MSNPTPLTRRCILGSLGAAALAKIILPFTPKPNDIVIASELPTAVEAKRIKSPLPEIEENGYLYDRHGNPVVVITRVTIDCHRDVTTFASDGWREFAPSVIAGTVEGRLLNPADVVRTNGSTIGLRGTKITETWEAV